jgi:DNA-binding transcriptional ArsR family regulator
LQPALEAIVEPRRREILRLLRDEEMTAGGVASHFEVTRPAISHHLSVLRGAGLLTERREGTRRIYRARPEGLAELRAYLEPFWGGRLETLKAEAEAEERRTRGGRGRRH